MVGVITRPRRSARTLAGLLAVVAVLLAGCGGSSPTVTFDVAGNALTAAPTQFCDNRMEDCTDDPNARVTADVPPATAIRITVPDEVSSGPWQVAYAFTRDGSPQPIQQRSDIAPAGSRTEFTLELPQPTDRLLTAQVQLFGPAPAIDQETLQMQFPVRATWVLVGEQQPAS
ncbi:hypothetical protein AD006_08500 [Pseudonocardia sp. EC080610-09]|nr:hypothetical protein FRP1_00865 [Pseudonocardia sp. EC080625-04]ALL75332.1 hypothetical protein AD006_08500 [Pseudonocardia sp. EC080610-09]ALL82357.1 hypothetical protein AD017_16330 [Pseudonocardia sp. EC080619-01]